jgi:tetratricopeptide (TPR) repeat protein
MRRLAILLVNVAVAWTATAAEARPRAQPTRTADPDRGDFWREVTEPHSAQVERLLFLARQMLQQTDNAQFGDYDPTGEQRAKFFVDVYGMMRYAHKLAPDNLEVLKLLAQSADELGKTRQALDALEAAVHLVGPDKVGPEIAGRLGAIYLRLGKIDDAIRFLRIAQGPVAAMNPTSAQVVVHLSSALAARGEMSAAIEVLENSLPPNVPYYSNELALVGFALAVQYDRDDQRGAAFDVLDRMQSQLQAQQFAAQVQNGLALMRWAPAEDQHYYQALLYEAMGHYVEARAEWALYAASGDLPFRARALQHIAAIDALPHRPPPDTSVRRIQINPAPPATP